MRILLSDGNYLYVQQSDIKLLESNNHIFVVGNDCLYGISSGGTRYRLNPESDYHLEEYSSSSQIVDFTYETDEDTGELVAVPIYDDVYSWTSSSLSLSEIPPSMNANDTYNFDNFGLSHLFVIFISLFVAFRIFVRR